MGVEQESSTNLTVEQCEALESTVRYLGIEVDDALAIAEQVDI
jgi:hypothetical protein